MFTVILCYMDMDSCLEGKRQVFKQMVNVMYELFVSAVCWTLGVRLTNTKQLFAAKWSTVQQQIYFSHRYENEEVSGSFIQV